MTTYLAWRGGNGVYGKWHILLSAHGQRGADNSTLCGKVAPVHAQVAMEHRNDAEDLCKTCTERKKRERQ